LTKTAVLALDRVICTPTNVSRSRSKFVLRTI
jgi:hypothetical protein